MKVPAITVIATTWVLAVSLIPPAQAQKRGGAAANAPRRVTPSQSQVKPDSNSAEAKAPNSKPATAGKTDSKSQDELSRFQQLTPEQQQQQLQNLPPERRKQIQDRLDRLNKLTPKQRDELQKRYEAFQNLPDDRQEAVRDELNQLRGMSESDRRIRLKSSAFKKEFNKTERKILQEVSGVPGGGQDY